MEKTYLDIEISLSYVGLKESEQGYNKGQRQHNRGTNSHGQFGNVKEVSGKAAKFLGRRE